MVKLLIVLIRIAVRKAGLVMVLKTVKTRLMDATSPAMIMMVATAVHLNHVKIRASLNALTVHVLQLRRNVQNVQLEQ
jgi:hypothetical protein